MTTLLVVMLIAVAVLLAWVIKLLLSMPKEGGGVSTGGGGESPFQKAIRESTPQEYEDIQDMTDRLLRRVDKKIDTLKVMLKEADEKINTINKGGYLLPEEFPDQGETPGHTISPEKKKVADERRARIVTLRRKGVSSEQIAREVGMGQGEVELILRMEGY